MSKQSKKALDKRKNNVDENSQVVAMLKKFHDDYKSVYDSYRGAKIL